MSITNIEKEFQDKVSEQIRLESEGVERFRVFTPFKFEDGDHLALILKKEEDRWLLSDEAHTFMHLTYDIEEKDLRSGRRQEIISNVLSIFKVDDREGELLFEVQNDQYGESLFSFVQALIRISDVSYLTREQVRSTFMEDFRSLIRESTPDDRREFDWIDSEHDPHGNYKVDCCLNGQQKPVFVFALANDDRTRDATIALHQYEKWERSFSALGIFQDQSLIGRKVLARFSDVCDKQFSSLAPNRERLTRYFEETLA